MIRSLAGQFVGFLCREIYPLSVQPDNTTANVINRLDPNCRECRVHIAGERVRGIGLSCHAPVIRYWAVNMLIRLDLNDVRRRR